MVTPRRVVLVTVLAALAVFAVVQDRVTAHGVQRYVTLQRAAAAAGRGSVRHVTIDEVMRPAVRRSVEQGLLWSGVTAAAGFTAAFLLRSKGGPEGPPLRRKP